MRAKLTSVALVLALGPGLAACLGFGGGAGDEEEAAPPPQSKLMTSAATRQPRKALGQPSADTWQAGAAAAAAAKAPQGPLDKSPTAFPAPPGLPTMPGAGATPNAVPLPAAQTGLPTLPGAAPAIPSAPPAVPAAPAQRVAAAPAPAPAAGKPGPVPPGVNIAAENAPILDVFRNEKKIGAMITRVDDVYAERSAQLALEYTSDGGSRGWTNPDTGTSGAIRPTRTFQQADGTYCREYAQGIQVRQKGGNDVKAQAEAGGRFACRQPNARWKFLP